MAGSAEVVLVAVVVEEEEVGTNLLHISNSRVGLAAQARMFLLHRDLHSSLVSRSNRSRSPPISRILNNNSVASVLQCSTIHTSRMRRIMDRQWATREEMTALHL